MKKVAFAFAVVATLAMVSCGGKKAENNDSVMDSVADTTVVEEAVIADSNETAAAVAVEETAAPAADTTKAEPAK